MEGWSRELEGSAGRYPTPLALGYRLLEGISGRKAVDIGVWAPIAYDINVNKTHTHYHYIILTQGACMQTQNGLPTSKLSQS
jgi:hypothetical protein